jgi:WD40 repeat protein
MVRIFLSHAAEDLEYAEDVRSWLREDGHETCTSAELPAPVGDGWKRALYRELRTAHAVVCIVTEHYLTSTYSFVEVGAADVLGCHLLPLRAAPGPAHPLLETRQYADYLADRSEARLGLTMTLRRMTSDGHRWVEGENPFPGLAPFSGGHATMFFGRESETSELADQLRRAAGFGVGAVAVAGPSGSGKSSLVLAGLVPALAADDSWLVVPPLVPGHDPVGALARRLVALSGVGRPGTPAGVRSALDDDAGLARIATDLLVHGGGSAGGRHLLVVIDQAEELFTRAGPAEREHFANLLHSAMSGDVRVVFTVRSEFLDDLRNMRSLAGAQIEAFLLGGLSERSLRRAVEQPARIAGLVMQPELVTRLVADARDGEALPLLAFALQRLAEGRHRGDTLSVAGYEATGGVQGAIMTQAEDALAAAAGHARLPEAEVLEVLAGMLTVDGAGRYGRRRIHPDGLAAEANAALDVFVDHRLLVSGADGGRRWVTLAHDALISNWPPLRRAADDRIAVLHTARAVEDAAAEWTVANRPDHLLWSRERLTAAVLTLGGTAAGPRQPGSPRPARLADLDLSSDARQFLDASERYVSAARALANRRRGYLTAALSFLLIASLVSAVVANRQQHSARSARRQAVTAERVAMTRAVVAAADAARDSRPADLATAMRLGAAGFGTFPGAETRASLVSTLVRTRYAGSLTDPSGRVMAVAAARTRPVVATIDDKKVVTVWNLAPAGTPTVVGRVRLNSSQSATPALSAAPNGSFFAVSAVDGGNALLVPPGTTGSGYTATLLPGNSTSVSDFAFAAHGRILAGAGYDGQVILWDVSSPTRPRLIGRIEEGSATTPGLIAVDDNRQILAVAAQTSVSIWSVTDPTRPRRIGRSLTGFQYVAALDFAPAGNTLAVAASSSGPVTLWNVRDPRAPKILGGPLAGATAPLGFSPAGNILMTGGTDHSVLEWDVTSATPRAIGQPLNSNIADVSSLDFAADGHTLITASGERSAVLWDIRTPYVPGRLGTLGVQSDISVDAVAFSPGDRMLATGTWDGTVLLWDMTDPANPAQIGRPLAGHDGMVTDVALSTDGQVLAAGGYDGTVTLWNMGDPTAPVPIGDPLVADAQGVNSIAISRDGRMLAAGGISGAVTLWNLGTGGVPTARSGQVLSAGADVDSVAISPDDRTLAAGLVDGSVTFWDVTDPAHPARLGRALADHVNEVTQIAFDASGHTLATGSYDGTANIWDFTDRSSPTRVGQVLSGTDIVTTIALAPDGKTLAVGGLQQGVTLWDLTDRTTPRPLGAPLPTPSSVLLLSVGFSRSGRILATGFNGAPTALWDMTPLDRLRNNPLPAACARGGAGLDPSKWALYAADSPYRDPCMK